MKKTCSLGKQTFEFRKECVNQLKSRSDYA